MPSRPRASAIKPQSRVLSTNSPVRTVIYVHGIGNKPVASILKCQWDTALFRTPMGDRTRLAYWVDRARYPEPVQAKCGDRDLVRVDDDQASAAAIMTMSATATPGDVDDPLKPLQRQIAALTTDPAELARINAIARTLLTTPVAATALSLSSTEQALRRIVVAQLTRAFVPDAYDFLFVPARRAAMAEALRSRLIAGDGPFVVIAHSQGSMIAYDVLRALDQAACEVRLFLTIGSPLGLPDVLAAYDTAASVPACVARWVNAADRRDPIAHVPVLAGKFAVNGQGVGIEDIVVTNLDAARDPHSSTGYLQTSEVQAAVIRAAGGAMAQPIGRTIVSADLVEQMEDHPERPHPVLIELAQWTASDGAPKGPDQSRDALLKTLSEMSGRRNPDNPIVPDALKRFVAADLTRAEVEQLRAGAATSSVHRIWRDSDKRTLIDRSGPLVQATTAQLGYKADGRGIGWAVVDTGINAAHPHFQLFGNVKAQWCCLEPGPPRPVSDEESATLDQCGHGTHVAGVIAGWLQMGAAPLAVTMAAMAPATALYGFQALDSAGSGRDSAIIKALEQIAVVNENAGTLVIHGVNLSLGAPFDPRLYGCGHTPLCDELRRLWRQGVLVCIAAGNGGYASLQSTGGAFDANLALSIGDPANLDESIAVGSVHKTNPHTFGVSFFSSRGPTADGRRKPDLVAPGEAVRSARHNAADTGKASDLYVEMSGTSMAAPHVSGILAAFLSVRREFIGYPDQVKQILLQNCTDLQRDPYAQGAGLANLVKMLVAT